MRQLGKAESILYVLSGILLAAGAGCYAFLVVRPLAAVCFLVGAVGYCLLQQNQLSPLRHHASLTVRRLQLIITFSHVLFLLSGLLMVEEQFQPVGNWLAGSDVSGGTRYLSFVVLTHGKWVVGLLIAAVVQLYGTHRISHELQS